MLDLKPELSPRQRESEWGRGGQRVSALSPLTARHRLMLGRRLCSLYRGRVGTGQYWAPQGTTASSTAGWGRVPPEWPQHHQDHPGDSTDTATTTQWQNREDAMQYVAAKTVGMMQGYKVNIHISTQGLLFPLSLKGILRRLFKMRSTLKLPKRERKYSERTLSVTRKIKLKSSQCQKL